jgi:NDP-sugar pyrophosphorylase family protein
MNIIDTALGRIAGIVLAGTHPWTKSAFDKLPPRSLLPVLDRPLISYALSWLREGGIQQVAVCGNRESRALRAWLTGREIPGMTVTYHQDPMPRGAAGSLHDAARAVDAETFVVTDAAAIPNVDLVALLSAHHAIGAAATVVVHQETRLINNASVQAPCGIYVFSRRALDRVAPHGFCDIKENLIPLLYRSGERVIAYAAPGATPRVFDASSYLAVTGWVLEHLIAADGQPKGFIRSANALIHEDARIAADAVCVGPVWICAGARVMSGAVIVGPASIGRDVVIEPGVLVSRSAVWRRSVIRERAIADRCIITDDSVIRAAGEAYGDVLVRNPVGHTATARTAAWRPEVGDRPPFDFLKRISRFFSTVNWSRSTAA